jgi:hypothetical protein
MPQCITSKGHPCPEEIQVKFGQLTGILKSSNDQVNRKYKAFKVLFLKRIKHPLFEVVEHLIPLGRVSAPDSLEPENTIRGEIWP